MNVILEAVAASHRTTAGKIMERWMDGVGQETLGDAQGETEARPNQLLFVALMR